MRSLADVANIASFRAVIAALRYQQAMADRLAAIRASAPMLTGPGYDPRFDLPRRYVDVAGTRLAVAEAGPADAPETLVFLHGLAGNMTHWIHVAPHFVGGDWHQRVRVVALDFRGCGASGRDRPYTIDAYVNDLMTLSNRLAIRDATWVGHSLGGMVGCALALQAPERVRRLIMLDPGGLRRIPRPLQMVGNAVLSRRLLNAVLPVGWLSVLGFVFAQDNEHTRDFIRYTDESFPPAHRNSDVGEIARVISDLKRDFLYADLSEELGRVRCPVGLVFGSEDRLVPASSLKALQRRCVDLTIEEIHGCGHMPNIENPARVIGFIEQMLRRSH